MSGIETFVQPGWRLAIPSVARVVAVVARRTMMRHQLFQRQFVPRRDVDEVVIAMQEFLWRMF